MNRFIYFYLKLQCFIFNFYSLFVLAPCPLSSFLPVIDCATGVASITWSTNVTGLVHSVTAVDAAGEMHNCSGTNIGCDLSSLKCGTEYNVTITPSRNKCVGKASSTERIQTGKDIIFMFFFKGKFIF